MAIRTCEWHADGNETLPHNYCCNPDLTEGWTIRSRRIENKCVHISKLQEAIRPGASPASIFERSLLAVICLFFACRNL